ncbi:uncharacterized protein C8Q71DRAFT_385465 [Rhodofomes roseus]|uniref:Uncharacterized protein n=1 Tax=Rhodofomes roseus TaxID=34475 RepID=A0ABQ8K032_9APHY|nr:uncharacterized protein C8Q71DRAFT_385465 [Rhodofomes roseus]KAH9829988.1 hypothetical protein C8Q71DRAFT_385465 [Rhodofomes roseus]
MQAPPSYDRTVIEQRNKSLDSVKPWGPAVDANDEHETFSLDKLNEFESTDFDRASRKAPAAQNQTHRRKASDSAEGSSPRKKQRLGLPDISLHSAIPRPHFYFPPDDILAVPAPEIGLDRYLTKNPPFPIPPRTYYSMHKALDEKYARTAWIVPIRGTPPWQGCTPASVLEPGQASNRTMSEMFHPRAPENYAPGNLPAGHIIWTHDALAAFWGFLLDVRSGGALGAISLSFNPAPPPQLESSTSSAVGGRNAAGRAVSSDPSTARGSSSNAVQNTHPTLLGMDHFKIYHDTRYSMHLRRVLHAWSFEIRNSEAVEEIFGDALPSTKIRLFKGARLVLLDGRSKGLLTM